MKEFGEFVRKNCSTIVNTHCAQRTMAAFGFAGEFVAASFAVRDSRSPWPMFR